MLFCVNAHTHTHTHRNSSYILKSNRHRFNALLHTHAQSNFFIFQSSVAQVTRWTLINLPAYQSVIHQRGQNLMSALVTSAENSWEGRHKSCDSANKPSVTLSANEHYIHISFVPPEPRSWIHAYVHQPSGGNFSCSVRKYNVRHAYTALIYSKHTHHPLNKTYYLSWRPHFLQLCLM